MLWITTPYHSNLACVNFVEPENYVLAVEQLPDGVGALRVIDGQLVRDNIIPTSEVVEPPNADPTQEIWNELAEAYKEGVQSAYDQ